MDTKLEDMIVDRKTLEAVLGYVQKKYNDADRVATNSSQQISRVDASAQCTAYRTIYTWVTWELGSLPETAPVEPAKADDSLSYHDVRNQLDEARAKLARIEQLARESIR